MCAVSLVGSAGKHAVDGTSHHLDGRRPDDRHADVGGSETRLDLYEQQGRLDGHVNRWRRLSANTRTAAVRPSLSSTKHRRNDGLV